MIYSCFAQPLYTAIVGDTLHVSCSNMAAACFVSAKVVVGELKVGAIDKNTSNFFFVLSPVVHAVF